MRGKERYNDHTACKDLPVDRNFRQVQAVDEELRPGQAYHLKWARRGARFLLRRYDLKAGTAVVWTGKTNNRELEVKITDMLHNRKRSVLLAETNGER